MTPTTRVGSWDGSLPPEAEPIHHPTWKNPANKSTLEKSIKNPINFQSSSPYPKEIPSPKLSPKNISDQW